MKKNFHFFEKILQKNLVNQIMFVYLQRSHKTVTKLFQISYIKIYNYERQF